jgi:hypothetical protein
MSYDQEKSGKKEFFGSVEILSLFILLERP